jgi:hypothetical protein
MICKGKREYETRKDAHKSKKKLKTRYNKKYRIYKCPDCMYWHLTTQVMNMSRIVEIEAKVKSRSSTGKAVMIENLNGENVWIPLSQCEIDANDNTIQMPEWLAIEKELV